MNDPYTDLVKRVAKLEEAALALVTATQVTGQGFIQMGATIDALAARVAELETPPEPPPAVLDVYQAYTAEREHRRVMESP